jgi:Berberine and berberine like
MWYFSDLRRCPLLCRFRGYSGHQAPMYAVLQPFGMDSVYVNNLGDDGADRVKAAYGENSDGLLMLKRKFDPDNLFRLNQNIHP